MRTWSNDSLQNNDSVVNFNSNNYYKIGRIKLNVDTHGPEKKSLANSLQLMPLLTANP